MPMHNVRATGQDEPMEWLEFDGDDSELDQEREVRRWRVDVRFMFSNWTCLFGRGCPGIFPLNSPHVLSAAGCCTIGYHHVDGKDYQRVKARMAQLTPDVWDDHLRKEVERNGAFTAPSEYDYDDAGNEVGEAYPERSRIFEGACVFANRGGSSGKIGCAFHHLGLKTDESHVETMPGVCWQLPIKMHYHEDQDIWTIVAWDIAEWTRDPYRGGPDKGGRPWHASYWCIDTPDAYIGENTIYVSMKEELQHLMGPKTYDKMVKLLDERKDNFRTEMPGKVTNGGRPLIPMLVGNRTQKWQLPDGALDPVVTREKRDYDSDGTSGQDRESYTDDQDRTSYEIKENDGNT